MQYMSLYNNNAWFNSSWLNGDQKSLCSLASSWLVDKRICHWVIQRDLTKSIALVIGTYESYHWQEAKDMTHKSWRIKGETLINFWVEKYWVAQSDLWTTHFFILKLVLFSSLQTSQHFIDSYCLTCLHTCLQWFLRSTHDDTVLNSATAVEPNTSCLMTLWINDRSNLSFKRLWTSSTLCFSHQRMPLNSWVRI